MVLLIDTNVLIDYLGRRPEYYENARTIVKFCAQPDMDGYIAFHSIPNIWFILRKESEDERRNGLKEVCSVLTVTGADHSKVVEAIEQRNFRDFEDCLQDKCAETIQADYIVTRNVNDFANSKTKAITPSDFITQFINFPR